MRDTNRISQAIATGTFSSESKKEVQIVIYGTVVVNDIKNYSKYKVQILNPDQPVILTKDVDSSFCFSIDTDLNSGNYSLELINALSSKKIKSQSFTVSKNNDRMNLNFIVD